MKFLKSLVLGLTAAALLFTASPAKATGVIVGNRVVIGHNVVVGNRVFVGHNVGFVGHNIGFRFATPFVPTVAVNAFPAVGYGGVGYAPSFGIAATPVAVPACAAQIPYQPSVALPQAVVPQAVAPCVTAPAYGVAPAFTPAYGVAPAFTPAYGVAPAFTPAYGVAPAFTPAYGVAPLFLAPSYGVGVHGNFSTFGTVGVNRVFVANTFGFNNVVVRTPAVAVVRPAVVVRTPAVVIRTGIFGSRVVIRR
jgi:hypothetical protein